MRVYTRSGDKGTTSLFGGKRVKKNHVRVESYGSFDEVNSFIGLLRAKLAPTHKWQENLYRIQGDIMDMMSHLATPPDSKKVNARHKPEDLGKFCENWIDNLHEEMGSLSENFLLPGGNEVSALCHVVRTQLRRVERNLVALNDEEPVDDYILQATNRLSDLFFVLSRSEIHFSGVNEERWLPFRRKINNA